MLKNLLLIIACASMSAPANREIRQAVISRIIYQADTLSVS